MDIRKDITYRCNVCERTGDLRMGSVWLCGAVVDSCPKGYEFDPGSRQLLGERGSALSLTLAQLYDL